MSGSSRSLQSSTFTALRVFTTIFTPEHSSGGKNINAMLEIMAFLNIESKDSKKRNPLLQVTMWGKRAHSGAKSMSEGKEFNCTARLDMYQGKVFKKSLVEGQPGANALDDDGTPLMVWKTGWTVEGMTYGEEGNKHIQRELITMHNGHPVRPAQWNVPGTQDYVIWHETLKARQAMQFDPRLPTYGFARVRMPSGAGIGAFIPTANGTVAAPAAGPAVDTAAAVAAAFTGVQPAGTVIPGAVIVPAAAPVAATEPVTINPGGFVVPGAVVPGV